jgi:hypothetical protein
MIDAPKHEFYHGFGYILVVVELSEGYSGGFGSIREF